jgi:hypothetical protein
VAVVRHGEHDLADVPRPGHQRERVGRLLQREREARQRCQLPVTEHAQHLIQHGREEVGPGQLELGQVDGTQGDVVPQRQHSQRRVGQDVAHPELDEPAERAERFQPGPDRRAGQRVQHDVHPLAPGGLPDLGREVERPRVHHVLDPLVPQEVALGVASRRGQHVPAQQPGHRDRGLAGATGGGVDQHLLARLQAGHVPQRVPGGQERGRNPGPGHRCQPVRQGGDGRRWHGDKGSERAAPRVEPQRAVTGPDVADPRPGGGDDARALEADASPRAVVVAEQAHDREHVPEVHPGCLHPQLDLACCQRAPRHRDQLQGSQLTEAARPQLEPVMPVADGPDGGRRALPRGQRRMLEPRHVPGAVPQRDLLVGMVAQQFFGQGLQAAVLAVQCGRPCTGQAHGRRGHVDLGGPQAGLLTGQHPDHAPDPAVGQDRPVPFGRLLGAEGDGVKPRWLRPGVDRRLRDARQPADRRQRRGWVRVRRLPRWQHHHRARCWPARPASAQLGCEVIELAGAARERLDLGAGPRGLQGGRQ